MDSNQAQAVMFRQLARVFGLLVAVVGGVVLAGWGFDVAMLRALPGFTLVGANCAAALFAVGLSIALLAPRATKRSVRRLGQGLALFAAVLMGLTLLEHALGRGVGIDGLFVRHRLGSHFTRVDVSSAAVLELLGLSLLLIEREARGARQLCQLLVLAAALISLQAIIAYFYGIEPSRGDVVGNAVQIAWPMGTVFALLCAAVLLARPEHGMVRVLASAGPAGFMARRMLVAIVLLPIILGWLFLVAGLRTGQYEAMVGASLVVLSVVVLGAAVVWWNASQIQRVDESRNSVEETLRAEREWFRTTLASIGDAVIAADGLGCVTDMNTVAEALTGARADSALGQPLATVFRVHGANRREIESPFDRVLRERRVVNLPRETVLIGRGGDEFPVEGCAAPIRDRRGRPRGVVLVFRDIRERRRVEEERASLLARERSARADAEQASRAKDEFIATLSHELRTPLNSVLGWARLLRLGKLDATGVRRAVEAIERGATNQAQIVDDLLDIARIVRGQLSLDVSAIELTPVIEAAIDTVRPAAAAREIEIVADLDPRAGPVMGDPGRLQQIAWNLFANAIKFTPQGGRVEVRLAHCGDHVEFSVRDTGAGISPEFLPHVFERFRQADSSTTRAHGGLGLGLAIVRHLVEAHGGTVTADSAGPGLGSTFTVSLPLAPGRAKAIEDLPAVRTVSSTTTPKARMMSLQDVEVLVVDDDLDTLEVLKQLLEQAGAKVRVAGSAPEALQALSREPPDVLVSDIGMPVQDGYELIRQVRELAPERGGQVPAAALSAFAHTENLSHAYAAGYQVFLAKPIDPSELTSAVARLAGRIA